MRKVLLILSVLPILFSCSSPKAPKPILQAGKWDYTDNNRRATRFIQALTQRALNWNGVGTSNPLAEICSGNYQIEDGACEVTCTGSPSFYSSARLQCGHDSSKMKTGVWELACVADYHQGFQGSQSPSFEVAIDPVSKDATITTFVGGVLYGLTDDWKYYGDQYGLFLMHVEGRFTQIRNNQTGFYTFTCPVNEAPPTIEGETIGCEYLEQFFAETCTAVH